MLDVDEDAVRRGEVAKPSATCACRGRPGTCQVRKAPSPAGEEASAEAIAADVVERMDPGRAFVLGPRTTLRAVAERLGLPKTARRGGCRPKRDPARRTDASEETLLGVVREGTAAVVVTPIGG